METSHTAFDSKLCVVLNSFIYLFVVYLKTLLVMQAVAYYDWEVINNGLESVGKVAIVA
jgi:hypothetical protein